MFTLVNYKYNYDVWPVATVQPTTVPATNYNPSDSSSDIYSQTLHPV